MEESFYQKEKWGERKEKNPPLKRTNENEKHLFV